MNMAAYTGGQLVYELHDLYGLVSIPEKPA